MFLIDTPLRLVAVAMLLALIGCKQLGQQDVHVLFVGNSYTNQHDVPGQVASIDRVIDGKRIHYKTRMVADNGMNLITYVNDARIVAFLNEREWDVIVLQDLSTSAFRAKERAEFDHAVAWFSDKARDEGARLILFQTWPRRAQHSLYSATATDRFDPPRTPREMLQTVKRVYDNAARRHRAQVSPVGECWLRSKDPAALYAWDGSHASKTGAALTARVLESTISGQEEVC